MTSQLQYRRRSSDASAAPAVDWDEVDDELRRTNPAFRDPRFDSLKHVLTVLISENAEAEVEELRDQRAHIEELVDAVVEGYHSGFNKSIHNYSQILRLFTESKLQLESLRRSLESAKRRLSAQSRHMSQQWQRHVTLTDTLRLLDDIQLIANVPAKLQRLEENKEWAAAVALLLDACNKLARQELSRVSALADLKEEMGKRRASLQGSILAELESRIYKLDASCTSSGSSSNGDSAGGAVPSSVAGTAPAIPLLQIPPRQLPGCSNKDSSAFGAGTMALAASASVGLAPAPVDLALAPSGLASIPYSQLPRRPLHRRAHTSGGLLNPVGALTALDGHLVEAEVPLPTLVDCLAQIGGIPEAQRTLRKHMPQRFKRAILQALELFPSSKHLPHNERYLHPAGGPLSPGRNHTPRPGGGMAAPCDAPIPPEVAATAQALVEHVLGCCLQVFQATVRLLHMLATAKAPKPSSGLELLVRQQRLWDTAQHALVHQALSTPGQPPVGQQQQQQPEEQGSAGELAKVECQAAWDALQCECEQLLGAVLAVQQAQASMQKNAGQTDVPGEGWLAAVSVLDASDIAGPASAPLDIGTLTFSLAHEVEELQQASTATGVDALGGSSAVQGAGGAGLQRSAGVGEKAGGGDGSQLVRQILGGHPGGAALVPVLYRPAVQFVEAAEQVLTSLTGIGGSDGGGSARHLFSMPWRAASDSAAAERSRLRAYVEHFLRMEFLPAVYVDFRARCTSVLDDSEAFRPCARLRTGPYQPSQGAGGGEGRPLLPAALATEQMVEELLGWAALMPPFATHLTGVVENILGRVLDAFQSRLAAVVGGSAAGRLAESIPLVRLMVKEPSAALLGSPVAFFVGGNTDAMESFVSSVIAAGFGANDESIEREILAKLMTERPIPPTALLSASGDARHHLFLAALSDSLDYVADVIQRCISAASGGSGTSGGGASGSITPQSDSWQTRLLSWRGRGGGLEKGLMEGLSHLADRYRAVAGGCMRVLRLDLLLLVVASLSELPRSSYVCSEEEAKEVDECIGALARSVGRLDEELAPYLPSAKRAYAFCSLGPAAARLVVWLLPEIREINHNGVSRVCRMLASLQPALLGVGGSGSANGSATSSSSSRPEASRQFDKAKLYYTLLTYSIEGLLATVAEKPHRFSPSEFSALLTANVPERPIATPEQKQQLQRTLAEAGAGGKGGGKPSKGGANAALAAFVKAVVKQQ